MHDDKMYTFFWIDLFWRIRLNFSQNNGNDKYFRPLMHHNKDILTNCGKILTNFKLTVAKIDRLTPDGKGHYYPHAVALYGVCFLCLSKVWWCHICFCCWFAILCSHALHFFLIHVCVIDIIYSLQFTYQVVLYQ